MVGRYFTPDTRIDFRYFFRHGKYLPEITSVEGLVRERQFCVDDSYSAYWSVMFPLSRQEALTLFDTGQIDIYLIYSDDTEAVCMTRDEILTHENGCFGIEHDDM